MNILFGIITLTVIIGLSYIISEDKKAIKWRTVIAGLLGQFVLIFFVIKVPIGQKILEALAIGVNNIIQMGMEGVTFVFGELTSGRVYQTIIFVTPDTKDREYIYQYYIS